MIRPLPVYFDEVDRKRLKESAKKEGRSESAHNIIIVKKYLANEDKKLKP